VPRHIPMLMKFYVVQKLFMPFILMPRSFSYYTNNANVIRYGIDFQLIWENHPFFGRRFRNIFEKIKTSCWRPTAFSGEMSLRSGKQIEHCEELYAHRNADSTKVKEWAKLITNLIAEKRDYDQRNHIGGKGRTKALHKTNNKRRTKALHKTSNKRRTKKMKRHRKN